MAQGEVKRDLQTHRLDVIDKVVGGFDFRPSARVKTGEVVGQQNIGHTENALYNGAALRHIKGAMDLVKGRLTHEAEEASRVLGLKPEDLNKAEVDANQRAGQIYQDEGKSIGGEAANGF
jgi:hypothetical protein